MSSGRTVIFLKKPYFLLIGLNPRTILEENIPKKDMELRFHRKKNKIFLFSSSCGARLKSELKQLVSAEGGGCVWRWAVVPDQFFINLL